MVPITAIQVAVDGIIKRMFALNNQQGDTGESF
jgi:hypothetical protein